MPTGNRTTDPESPSERLDRLRRENEQRLSAERRQWFRQSTGMKVNDAVGWIQDLISEGPDDLTYGDIERLERVSGLIRELASGEFICSGCCARQDAEQNAEQDQDDGIAF